MSASSNRIKKIATDPDWSARHPHRSRASQPTVFVYPDAVGPVGRLFKGLVMK